MVDRRQFMLASGALAASALGIAPALAATPPVVTAANAFLASLDDTQRAAASFDWAGDTWRRWNFMGGGGFIKPGLRLEQMTVDQREKAWALAAEFLSPVGLDKARRVMDLQDVLMERGGSGRSGQRFSWAFHGTPAATGTWGFRIEGHHLSLSFTARDGVVVAATPSSFSSNPNIVRGGSRDGLVALAGEETIGRRLFADLDATNKARALISETALRNTRQLSGRERTLRGSEEGVAVADMTASQRDLFRELAETFAVEHLAGAMRETARARLRADDPAARFAWAGANEPGRAFYVRLVTPTFGIDLGSVDAEAQHLHTAVQDFETTLGGLA